MVTRRVFGVATGRKAVAEPSAAGVERSDNAVATVDVGLGFVPPFDPVDGE